MRTAVVLFTRDLRLHDQPALAAGLAAADQVVPLFVLDGTLLARVGAPNRVAFLLDALGDLAASLRERGGVLAVRRGEVVDQAMRVARETGAQAIFLSEDVSAYAQARERRLQAACRREGLALHVLPGVTVVPPGDLAPAGSDHYRVFTPYWRRWQRAPHRSLARTPRLVAVPRALRAGRIPALGDLLSGSASEALPKGGESEGRRRATRWLSQGLGHYDRMHDDLAGDGTSRLGPYLHFGCLSPLELAARASAREGAEPFLRQLAWRDFYAQLLAARPETSQADFRPRGRRWRSDAAALAAWKGGRTGVPIIDAGMRQLAGEGWMHNRVRLLTGSFLTRNLRLDWRLGAAHFFDLLVDGDAASNVGNWQWVAGTGVDTRPNRIFNPIRQARRLDPDGIYVRRHVPELAGIEGRAVHEPWKLARPPEGYPEPILDPAGGLAGA